MKLRLRPLTIPERKYTYKQSTQIAGQTGNIGYLRGDFGSEGEAIKRRFINEVYEGDYGEYLRARKSDYLKCQFEWECYIDTLCKDGEISLEQYENAIF